VHEVEGRRGGRRRGRAGSYVGDYASQKKRRGKGGRGETFEYFRASKRTGSIGSGGGRRLGGGEGVPGANDDSDRAWKGEGVGGGSQFRQGLRVRGGKGRKQGGGGLRERGGRIVFITRKGRSAVPF